MSFLSIKPVTLFNLFLYLVISTATYGASEPIVVNNNTDEVFISGDYIEILEDSVNKLTITEVASPAFQVNFDPVKSHWPINYNYKSSYWLKIKLQKHTNLHKNLLIESYTFRVNELDVYIKDKTGSYRKHQTGDSYRFSKRELAHKNFEFLIPQTNRKEEVIYIRYKTGHPTQLMLVLRSFEKFASYALAEYFLLGLFYGVVLVIAAYNLFLFFTIRERAYLYYVFYVISVGLYAMALDGTGFQYLWSSFPAVNQYAVSTFLFFLVIWLLMYTREFLPVKEKTPVLNKIILGYIIARAIIYLLSITVLPEIKTYLLLDVIPFLLAYITSLEIYRKGFKPARYFIAGFSVLLLSFVINALMYAKIVVSNIYTVYSMNIGVVIEMILLSVALAERVRLLREEKLGKEKENKLLESMVQERTQKLQEANSKLKQQAEAIADMNIMLSADNTKLKEDVKKISENRVMQSELNLEEFSQIYPDDESCYKYLAELKWEKGFSCLRCKNDSWSNGRNRYSRRCSKCGYDESPSAYTIFHSMKFPITKAFYMLFLTAQNPDVTVEELSERLSLTPKTCWSFKKKIAEAMSSGKTKKGRRKNKWASLILQNKKA